MSNLITRVIKVEIDGFSKKSKTDAINNAFSNLKKKVMQEETLPVIYMKPTNVEVLDYQENTKTEKFLFVLFPKERTEFCCKLQVEIEISILNI